MEKNISLICFKNNNLNSFVIICPKILDDRGVALNADLIDQLKQKDVEARTFIYSTMKPEKQTTLQGCTTAFEMWSRIFSQLSQSVSEVSAESEPLLWGQFYSYKFKPGINLLEIWKNCLIIMSFAYIRSNNYELCGWYWTNRCTAEGYWSSSRWYTYNSQNPGVLTTYFTILLPSRNWKLSLPWLNV